MRFVALLCTLWLAWSVANTPMSTHAQEQQGGKYTYILELDDELLEALKNGEPLESQIPEHMRGHVTTIRLKYKRPENQPPNNTSGNVGASGYDANGFDTSNGSRGNSSFQGNPSSTAGTNDPTAFNSNGGGFSPTQPNANSNTYGPTPPPNSPWSNNNQNGSEEGTRVPINSNTGASGTINDRGYSSDPGGQFQGNPSYNQGQPGNNYSQPPRGSSSEVDTVSYPPSNRYPRDEAGYQPNFVDNRNYQAQPNQQPNQQLGNAYPYGNPYPQNHPAYDPQYDPYRNQGYGTQQQQQPRYAAASMLAAQNGIGQTHPTRKTIPVPGHDSPLIPNQPVQSGAYPDSRFASTSQSSLPPASIQGQLPDENQEGNRLTSTQSAILWFMLLCSIGLNVYLGWIARGFYVRYQELADDLRETFATAS